MVWKLQTINVYRKWNEKFGSNIVFFFCCFTHFPFRLFSVWFCLSFKWKMEKKFTIQKIPIDLNASNNMKRMGKLGLVGLRNADQKIGQKCAISICFIISTIINGYFIICLLVIKTLQTMQVWRKTLCSHVLCYMYTKYVDTSVQRNNIFNTKLLFTEWKQNANVSLKTLNADCWLLTDDFHPKCIHLFDYEEKCVHISIFGVCQNLFNLKLFE